MEANQLIQALNLAPALAELKPPETGDELNLFLALGKVQLRNATHNMLKEVLRLVMVKIGLRSQNWPIEEEKMVLIEHINNNFGGHTLEEIKLAFDMAIAGKLEEINSKNEVVTLDPNCYENFSCLYFSKILNAYRSWAKEAVRHLPKKEVKLLEENKTITDEEMFEWVKEWTRKIKDVENPALIPPAFYTWLESHKLIKLSKEEKLDYLTNQAVALRHYNLSELVKSEGENGQAAKDLNDFKRMREAGCFTGIEVERLKELARKIVVFDYLKMNQAEEK